jgi:transcriptional regulator GlxA family with amidase domain
VVRVDAASRRMLRARDKMDRSYDKPLDVAALARVALTSEAHFIRTFKETFGETPHRYLQPAGWSERWRCCARPSGR